MDILKKVSVIKGTAIFLVSACVMTAPGCKATVHENDSGGYDSGGNAGNGNTGREEEEMSIGLTQRQKELLKERGLPTDYDELTASQKNAIVSIEDLLTYLEDKYEEKFCYLSYTAAGALEQEHLEAYPESGLPSDVVTVYRTYEDGEYHCEDDYGNIRIKPLYEDRVRGFAEQTFSGGGIKVFSDIRISGQAAEKTVTEENVVQTVPAVTYIFISDSVCTEEQFHDFTDKCAGWLETGSREAAAQICLRLTEAEQWEMISESDYEDKLREDIFTAEAECIASASGKVTVY